MVTIVSYAVGKVYRQELVYMVQSCQNSNPGANMIIGEGNPGEDTMNFFIFKAGEQISYEKVKIPIKAKYLEGWNRLGFLKPWFIIKCIHKMRTKLDDELMIWVDADAKVRRSVESISRELTAPVGLTKSIFNNKWNAGTIAMRDYHEVMSWLLRWWDRCKPYFNYDHKGEWKWNDQTVLWALINEGHHPGICELGKKWCNIVPRLKGSKQNPPIVRPDMDDAIIWHWQASRGQLHGWNWPPKYELRAE